MPMTVKDLRNLCEGEEDETYVYFLNRGMNALLEPSIIIANSFNSPHLPPVKALGEGSELEKIRSVPLGSLVIIGGK